MADEVRLTGHVRDWDDDADADMETIRPEQAQEYEANGYTVETLGDRTMALRFREPDDGDIQIQPKLDMYGRDAVAHGNTNFGYSGYFRGYVYVGGKRRRLVGWWTLFPNEGHHYSSQGDKPSAEVAIRARIEALTGSAVVKVKGGYKVDH
jgi:hypothetical protein